MARGSEAKEAVITKILETFPESFKHDKEIRIPMVENGEVIQIKCTLTAAKVNVENGSDTAIPGAATLPSGGTQATPAADLPWDSEEVLPPTEEEKANLQQLLEKLK